MATTDQMFRTEVVETFLPASTENFLGFFVEESVKQLSGYNRREFMAMLVPSFRSRAEILVFESQPIRVKETKETGEPQPIQYASLKEASQTITVVKEPGA